MIKVTLGELKAVKSKLREFLTGGTITKALAGHPVQVQDTHGRWSDVSDDYEFRRNANYRVDADIVYVNDVGERFKSNEEGHYIEVSTGRKHVIKLEDCDEEDYGPIHDFTGIYKTPSGALYGYKAYYEKFPEERPIEGN
jgi:hypothetical protein